MDIDKLIEFTQHLVQRRSMSGEEKAVADRVQAEMQSLGFDHISVDENGSVIGIIEGNAPGKTILLDAHIDNVGISPGVPWAHDPFEAKIVNSAIVGRGTADMKGACAAMVYAAANVDRSKFKGRVAVSASTMEEVLEGVCLQTVMEITEPDFVVIGESTGLDLARGGRGRAEVHLETVGKPSHSSSPELGHNAVLDMVKVIQAVEAISLDEHALMGPAIMALTDIISDPYPGISVIPSICRVTYDRRLLPGETKDEVLDAVSALLGLENVQLNAKLAQGEHVTYTNKTLLSEKFYPAWIYPADHFLVEKSLAGLHALGMTPEVGAYRFCTNGAYSAGIAGVPTIGFGPATEADAHVVNEQVTLADLEAVAHGYVGIIESVLG